MSIKLALKELETMGVLTEENLLLSKHSTFKIGGACALAVFPQSREELKGAVQTLKYHGIKYRVIGRGSNIIFSDDGYSGALIFTSKMKTIIKLSDREIYAEAGASLKSIASFAQKNGLTGLEFAHGIPGSCGGGIYMNAGAYGGEISYVLKYSEYYDTENDCFERLSANDHNFSYRHSIYEEQKKFILVAACFALENGDPKDIKAIMDENMQKRREKQPIEYPSAGSAFKRPPNAYAAQMIDECGLKGLSVGDAQVSKKHAGFIINKGKATAQDVKLLMELVKQEVIKKFGVELESEIEYID